MEAESHHTWSMRACSEPVHEESQASRRSGPKATRRLDTRASAPALSCAAASADSASLRSVGSVRSELAGARTGLGASDSRACARSSEQACQLLCNTQ